jgi:hypothetical protein
MPRQMFSSVVVPKAPEISLGDSYFIIKGAIDVNKPTQNP